MKVLKNTFAAITVALVALMMTVSFASAQVTSSQLEALGFNNAQISALMALLGAPAPAMSTSATPFNWNGTLIKYGSTGTQVAALQTCMNSLGFTTGTVDGIYGPNTQSGIVAFQNSKGLTPDGIVGPMTAPHFEAACNASAVVVVDNNDDDNDSPSFDVNDGEEADFSDVDVSDADDDTIEEGANRAELAEIEFDLEEGGAAMLERFDVILEYVGLENADEDEPWEVFETIYLSVDGDIIAEEDADDEDDWADSSVSTDVETRFRISGINYAFDADETHTIVVHADLAGSIDLGGDDQANWEFTLLPNSMRFVDEAGITQYLGEEVLGNGTETASFTIESEGQDDEFDVRSSNDDPNSATLKVEDDSASDDYTVFVFELEADDDSSDIDLDKVGVEVTVVGTKSTGAGADGILGTADDVTVAATFDDIVKDAMLVIDGDEFDDIDAYVDGANVTLFFDIDKDFTIDAGDRVDVELVLEFKSANFSNYAPGATVQAQVDGADVSGDGADDLDAGGSATGDTHTLQIEGLTASTDATSANVVVVDGDDNDYAEFEIVLDVEAFEEDAFVSQFAATSLTWSIIDASNGNVVHDEAGQVGGSIGNAVASLSGTANLEGNFFRINENDSETLTFTVTYTPGDGGTTVGIGAGSYRLQLDTIEFNSVAAAPNDSYATIPSQDFRTGNANVTN